MSLVRFPTDFDVDDIDHEGQGRGLVFWGAGQSPGSNLYVDSSLYGNDGTLQNMEPATDWVDGPHGPALYFDGNEHSVHLGSHDVSRISNAPMSVTAWVRPNITPTGFRRILCREKHFLFGTFDTEFLFGMGNGGSSWNSLVTFGSDAALTNGRWYHLAASYDGGTVTGYVNGRDVGTITSSMVDAPIIEAFICRPDGVSGTQTWLGDASDPRIYDRALSDSEVWDLYSNPTGIILPRRRVFRVGAANPFITADPGSYSITGTDAALKVDRTLSAESGSYAITGTDADLQHGRRLSAEPGSYAITGTDASLRQTHVLAAEAGSYTISGTDATLVYSAANPIIEADAGAYAISGTDAGLKLDHVLSAESGTYAISGTDATLISSEADPIIGAETGAYALTGTSASLKLDRVLSADPGTYAITGTSASLNEAATAVYYRIVQAVLEDIKALSLANIPDANIQVVKANTERETVVPAIPGILIVTFGEEGIPETGGTLRRDQIGYPVQIVIIDVDRQSSVTGVPSGAEEGTVDQDYNLATKLLWRQQIRRKFINQRLSGVPEVFVCYIEPQSIVDAETLLNDNLWISAFGLRFITREVRG